MIKKVLVTGGAGFIGSNLIRTLKKNYENIEIISLDNYSSGFERNHVDGVIYIRGNTWDISKIEKLQEFEPDWVYHLGEFSRVCLSFEKPNETFRSNMFGTQCIFDYCVKKSSKLIYSASSAIFGNNFQDSNLNPYSWSKMKNIELISRYHDWFDFKNYAIVYFYNVYGNGHIKTGNYSTVIGIFEYQYENNKPLTVVSPGTQSRSFTHIDDIVDGLIKVAEKGKGNGYCLGTNKSTNILELVEMFGVEYELIPKRKGERESSLIQYNNAETELDWKPTKDLREYIENFKNSFFI